ncbi:hypothetical protein ASF56_23825 [Methylobacterium sp. Leaf122]|nr:hypothetical protein [Methylobacterium sp. Leaf122]KQQ15517.1 hypothetical protein ASF56_23825 [Methylobacterium sp. Leaf122]
MKRNELTFTKDPNGRDVVGVLLTNRPVSAWLYLEDYARVLKAYPNATWGLISIAKGKRNYVRLRGTGKGSPSVYVARLIAGDFERTAVQFKDGNALNLRNTNLMHVPGGGKCRKRLAERAALRISTEAVRV